MKFEEFLEVFKDGGKVSFIYEGKHFDFLRTFDRKENGEVDTSYMVYNAAYCNGVDLFYYCHGDIVAIYQEFIDFMKNLEINGVKLEDIINEASYEENSLKISYDLEMTTIADLINRVNVGFDLDIFYNRNDFYFSHHGREIEQGKNTLVFSSVQYNNKPKICTKLTPTVDCDLDSENDYSLACIDMEEYYLFLKTVKIDGVKLEEILEKKLYHNYRY